MVGPVRSGASDVFVGWPLTPSMNVRWIQKRQSVAIVFARGVEIRADLMHASW